MNEVSITKKQVRRQEWTNLIRQQQVSGLTIRQWCQTHQISEPSFYYYLHCIREDMLKSQSKSPQVQEMATPTMAMVKPKPML
jgi:hypothetical protein